MSSLANMRAMMPAATLVLTAGDHGGIVSRETGYARYEAVAAVTVDATGAGDVFLAALVAAWLLVGELASGRALRFAAAAAACSVEGPGIARIPTGAEIGARLAPGMLRPSAAPPTAREGSDRRSG
jgi:sugar/nucleoside kinase (ribokinase family)